MIVALLLIQVLEEVVDFLFVDKHLLFKVVFVDLLFGFQLVLLFCFVGTLQTLCLRLIL